MSTLLSVAQVNVTFGGLRALKDVYLDLHENEIVGLIGPNGAGKTTLLNAISGLVKPDSGSFTLFGKEENWPKPHQLVGYGISRTLQGVGLFADLTVLENVMIGAQKFATAGLGRALLGRTAKDESALRDRAMLALERVYAGGLADRRADTLAYPETKRVAIARALISEPKILLLDEPAGGLGKEDIEWLGHLIKNLRRDCSIILVEHHMDVVMAVCERLYVLDFGEVISSGSADKVREDPAVIAAYLGTAVGEP
ncbi:MAG: ABC transporter ATP-binding protein [Actinomycetota bacterium]